MKISNKSNTSFDKLCRANDEYNRLVRSGAIKKRGFTLRGVEDVHLHNGYNFNR